MVGLHQKAAIRVGLFKFGLTLIGIHRFYGGVTGLRAFDLLLERAINRALLAQLNTIKIRPRIEFAVSMTEQLLPQLPSVLPERLEAQPCVEEGFGHNQILLSMQRSYLTTDVNLLAIFDLVK